MAFVLVAFLPVHLQLSQQSQSVLKRNRQYSKPYKFDMSLLPLSNVI